MAKVSMTVHYTVEVKLDVPAEVDDTGDEIAMRHKAQNIADRKLEAIPPEQWKVIMTNPDFITVNRYTTRR